jgi:hypothetical protein
LLEDSRVDGIAASREPAEYADVISNQPADQPLQECVVRLFPGTLLS